MISASSLLPKNPSWILALINANRSLGPLMGSRENARIGTGILGWPRAFDRSANHRLVDQGGDEATCRIKHVSGSCLQHGIWQSLNPDGTWGRSWSE